MKYALLLLASLPLFSANLPEQEKQITQALESLKTAMIQKDGAALEKLLSPDLLYIHSAGMRETKADVVRSISSGKSVIQRLDYSKTTIRIYGDTALANANVDLYHSPTDIVHMNVLFVWHKHAGGWQLVSRQATKLVP